MSIPHGIRAVSFEGTRFKATSNQLNKDNYTQWSAILKGTLMVNKVGDIVNEDRIKPPQPKVHELGVEVATSKAIAVAIIAADKYDGYLEDYTRAACLLAESISDAELVAITTVLDDLNSSESSHACQNWGSQQLKRPSSSFSTTRTKRQRRQYPGLRPWWPNAGNKKSAWRMTFWSGNSLINPTIGTFTSRGPGCTLDPLTDRSSRSSLPP